MKKHIAIVLFKTGNLPSGAVSFDETVLSVLADSLRDAWAKAKAYGQSLETEYENQAGEKIAVRFLKVVDVTEWLRPENGDVTELYSRHFTDWEAYARFDSMAEKVFPEPTTQNLDTGQK